VAEALDIGAAVSEIAELPPEPARASSRAAPAWVEGVWRFFCSLQLTLVNILLLFLAMVAGTFVNPSGAALTEIESAFRGRPVVLWAYRTFELYDLFHSWWFTLLLLSLALNLVACSTERLPRILYLVRFPEIRLDRVRGIRFRVPLTRSPIGPAALERELRQAGWRVHLGRSDGGADLFAERGRFSRFGVWIVHLSLLVILGGGIAGRLTAFEGTAFVPQGSEVDSMIVRRPDGSALKRKLGFVVRCDDFRLKEFEPGRPKAFESDLRVFERLPDGSAGRELQRKTIAVNHPLEHGGLTFYQSSYQELDEPPRASISILDKVTGTSQAMLVRGERIQAAEGLTYQLVAYEEDRAGQGPAVQVARTEGSQHSAFWVFARAPDFDRLNREDRFAFSFSGLRPLYATGLQVARDPSTPIIYLGCFLLFAGAVVAFYTSHKRLWARFEGGTLAIGAAAHRNPDGFRVEMEALCGRLGLPMPESAQRA
jgi:cytochrome c biogenesis protein